MSPPQENPAGNPQAALRRFFASARPVSALRNLTSKVIICDRCFQKLRIPKIRKNVRVTCPTCKHEAVVEAEHLRLSGTFPVDWLRRHRIAVALCLAFIVSILGALGIASHRAAERRLAPYRLKTELSPRDGYAWMRLGEAYAAEKRFRDAEKALKKAVALGQSMALRRLGSFYRDQGRFREAALCFEQAHSYRAAGDIYAAMGDQASAKRAYEKASSSASVAPTPVRKEFSLGEMENAFFPPKPLPKTGYRGDALHGLNPFKAPPQCPFKVTVPNDGFHYWIKLREKNGSTQYLFVRSGETAAIDIDLGNYTVTYAIGKTWRGDDSRFGSETRYFKCDREFIFYQEDDHHFHGYTVELYPQPNGNLATTPITASEF